jgi:asparaginyl-tRNA synthetase
MKTYIKNITAEQVGQEITLNGWISQARASGKVAFVELRDGTGFIQCVAEPQNVGEEKFDVLKSLNIESAISVTGTVSKHPKKELFELQIKDLTVYADTKDYPLGQKEHNPEFLFDNRHLYLRSKSQRAIQRIRNTIIYATYDWMRDNDFIKIDAPIFTPSACEGTTELYEVEHVNGETMYLSQSGQLYIEAAIAAHGRVFDFGPVFRAEKSKTRRHLNEFWMMDAEMAFVSFEENLQIQEDLIFYIVQTVLAKHKDDLAILERNTAPLEALKKPFIRWTHAQYVEELIKAGFDVKQ